MLNVSAFSFIGGALLGSLLGTIKTCLVCLRSMVVVTHTIENNYSLASIKWIRSKKHFFIRGDTFITNLTYSSKNKDGSVNYTPSYSQFEFQHPMIVMCPFPVYIRWKNRGLVVTSIRFLFNCKQLCTELMQINDHETESFDSDDSQSYYFDNFCIIDVNGDRVQTKNPNEDNNNQMVPISTSSDQSNQQSSSFDKLDNDLSDRHCYWSFLSDKMYNRQLVTGKFSRSVGGEDSFTNLAYSDEIMEVDSIIKKWISLRSWYRKMNIVWKRGFLLYGKPGTGKSSFVCAIAKKYGITVYNFHLSTFNDVTFQNEIKKYTSQSTSSQPCILLFEDIDCIYDNRNNKVDGDLFKKLTFSELINSIDGISDLNSCLIFFTTNNIDSIDSALRRGGRIDHSIFFDYPKKEEKVKIVNYFLNEYPQKRDEMITHVENIEISHADLKSLVIKELLSEKISTSPKEIK